MSATQPASRTELKEYCLRALGKPVIQINVDDDQLEDRIEESLQMFQEYHVDATIKTYLKQGIPQKEAEAKVEEQVALDRMSPERAQLKKVDEGPREKQPNNIRHRRNRRRTKSGRRTNGGDATTRGRTTTNVPCLSFFIQYLNRN